MRRLVVVGAACVALMAGCSSSPGSSSDSGAAPTSTEAGLPSATELPVSIAPLPAAATTAKCTDALAYVTAEDQFNADHAQDAGPVVAFLGDSYTAGVGAADVSEAWSALLAKQEGWRPVLLGFPSTGIHNGGVCGGRYFAARLRAETDSGVQTITGALASADGVTFVDASGWFTAANRSQLVGPDGNHPTPAGHEFLASQVAAALGPWPDL